MKYLAIFTLLLCSLQLNAQENISLITPYDRDTVETANPLLAWYYMDALGVSDRWYYRLIVVELKDEQSAEAGIIVNQPLVKMNRLEGTQQFYPFDAPKLEAGHRYGWQIQKVKDNIIVDKSEAWEFRLASPEYPEYVKYVSLKTRGDGTLYEAVGGKIFFTMEEKYDAAELNFTIYDEEMQPVNKELVDDTEDSENAGEINVKSNGSNFYELDLGGFAKAGTYTMILLDARNRKYKLKFFIR